MLNGVEPIKRPEGIRDCTNNTIRDCTNNTITQIKTYEVSVSTDLTPF